MIIEYVTKRPPCEREIGSPKRGWHACGRPAYVFADRQIGTGGAYRVYYCRLHAKHAEGEGPGVRKLQTGKVEQP